MDIVWISLAGFGGAVVNGLIGWHKNGVPFDAQKFLPTFLRALLSGGTLAIPYPLVDTLGLPTALVGAFLAGAGFDDVWHRLAGTIKK